MKNTQGNVVDQKEPIKLSQSKETDEKRLMTSSEKQSQNGLAKVGIGYLDC